MIQPAIGSRNAPHASQTVFPNVLFQQTGAVGTVEYAIIAFMFLGGISMILHYRFWLERSPLAVLKDVQLRAYVSILLIAGVVATVLLRFHNGYAWEPALRAGFFQVTSITTTTGLVTDDFELWHPLGQMLLLGLMFVGGCTGSTSGGLKVARLLLLTQGGRPRTQAYGGAARGVHGSSRIARHPGVDSSKLAEPGLHGRRRRLGGVSVAGLNGCGRLDIAHRGHCRGIQHRPRVWRSWAVRQLQLAACRSQMGLECLYDCRSPRVLLRARSADALVLAQVGGWLACRFNSGGAEHPRCVAAREEHEKLTRNTRQSAASAPPKPDGGTPP